MREDIVGRAFLLAGIVTGCMMLSGCGGGGGASVAPAVQATTPPASNGTAVAALAVVYSGSGVVVETYDFEAEVMPVTSGGSVITDGTVLAYPIAVTIGGGCAPGYSMTTQVTSVPIPGWVGATPPTGCTGSAISIAATTTSSTGGKLSAGPISMAATGTVNMLGVSINGLANVSHVPALTIPVFVTSGLNPTYTIGSSTCPAGSLTGGSSLVLTPPLQAFTCSVSLTVAASYGSTQSYALTVTST